MKLLEYKAGDRGYRNFDWLQANYSFSFANYYNPGKTNFGALRVLNDDVIQGGTGFGEHSHDNMEIITIPLQGSLKHKDSMSEKWITLHTGEVQIMSAGSGILHSEKNNSSIDFINLFQIWIIPDQVGVEPVYKQMKFNIEDRKDKLQTLVTSYNDLSKESLKIHQNAKISRLDLSQNNSFNYNVISEEHGVYIMLISGEVSVGGKVLNQRDAIGVSEIDTFSVSAIEAAELLFIEVPMTF